MFGSAGSLLLIVFAFLFGRLDSSWHGNLSAFNQVSILFEEGLDAATEQKCVLVAFFCEQGRLLGPLPLIIHVRYN